MTFWEWIDGLPWGTIWGVSGPLLIAAMVAIWNRRNHKEDLVAQLARDRERDLIAEQHADLEHQRAMEKIKYERAADERREQREKMSSALRGLLEASDNFSWERQGYIQVCGQIESGNLDRSQNLELIQKHLDAVNLSLKQLKEAGVHAEILLSQLFKLEMAQFMQALYKYSEIDLATLSSEQMTTEVESIVTARNSLVEAFHAHFSVPDAVLQTTPQPVLGSQGGA